MGQKGNYTPHHTFVSLFFWKGKCVYVCVCNTVLSTHMFTDGANHTQNAVLYDSKPDLSLSVPTWNPSHSSVCLPVVIPTGISRVGIQSCSPFHKPHPSRSLNAQIWPEFLAWKKTVADFKRVSSFRVGRGKIDTFTTGFNFPPLLFSLYPLLLRLRGP